MIVGVGIDVIEIEKVREAAERNHRFLERTFAVSELRHSQEKHDPYPHLAARFAAKEAVMKALGTGWNHGVTWTDIAVHSNPGGQPAVHLSGAARRFAQQLGVGSIHISLTHSRDYAAAQVVLEQ
jgi:holo-[acyl-carrier protein] synthase